MADNTIPIKWQLFQPVTGVVFVTPDADGIDQIQLCAGERVIVDDLRNPGIARFFNVENKVSVTPFHQAVQKQQNLLFAFPVFLPIPHPVFAQLRMKIHTDDTGLSSHALALPSPLIH